MNNKTVIAAVIAAAGIAFYLFAKKYKSHKANKEFVGARAHHLTDVFTRAKVAAGNPRP